MLLSDALSLSFTVLSPSSSRVSAAKAIWKLLLSRSVLCGVVVFPFDVLGVAVSCPVSLGAFSCLVTSLVTLLCPWATVTFFVGFRIGMMTTSPSSGPVSSSTTVSIPSVASSSDSWFDSGSIFVILNLPLSSCHSSSPDYTPNTSGFVMNVILETSLNSPGDVPLSV